MIRVLHISYSNTSSDGGVYFYLKELIKHQKEFLMDTHWITIKNENLKLRKQELLKKIVEIKPTIIHIHGIWNLSTRIIPQLKKITKNIIVSPHGMLNHESLRKSYLGKQISLKYLKKKIYLLFIEKRNLNHIKSFHALTEAESNEIKYIFPNKSIKIISTGFKGNYAKKTFIVKKNLRDIFSKNRKILLFIGRLERQKGVIELITAWNKIVYEAEKYGWWLLIAGFGSLSKSVIANSKKTNSRIIFNGPIFGEEKNFILQNSKGFILPSYNEGLPISLLEALSFKNTCLISENCNLNNLINSNISLKININKNSNDIKDVLIKLFQLSERDLQKREESGLKYLENNHNWDKIISQTNIFYKNL